MTREPWTTFDACMTGFFVACGALVLTAVAVGWWMAH